jgi:hypothetical protein
MRNLLRAIDSRLNFNPLFRHDFRNEKKGNKKLLLSPVVKRTFKGVGMKIASQISKKYSKLLSLWQKCYVITKFNILIVTCCLNSFQQRFHYILLLFDRDIT